MDYRGSSSNAVVVSESDTLSCLKEDGILYPQKKKDMYFMVINNQFYFKMFIILFILFFSFSIT